MSGFEDRLRADLRDAVAVVDATAPPVEPVLLEAAARRQQRTARTVSVLTSTVLLVLTAAVAARAVGDGGWITDSPERRPAELVTGYVTTTTPRPATSVVAPPATSTTTTAAATAVPLAQRVPTGIWIVGLDGSGLRRIGDVGRFSWSPDGSMVAIATDRIWILSATDGHAVSTIESGPSPTHVRCLDWSAKGTLAWVDGEGAVRYAAAASDKRGAVVATGVPAAADAYYDDQCRWSPDGSAFATPGAHGFSLFDERGVRIEVATDDRVASTGAAKWSPDGRSLAATVAGADGTVRQVAVLSGDRWSDLDVVPESDAAVRVVWSADGRKLLMREGYKTSSFDPVTGTTSVEVTAVHPGLAALPGGDFLTVGGGASVQFLSATWAPRGVLLTAEAHPDRCEGAFFAHLRLSPSGRAVAVEAQAQGGVRCDKARAL